MRVFIGIEFDEPIKQYLKDVQDVVKTTTISGEFTLYSNFHLTLKYIGQINNNEFDELCDCIDDVSKDISPFYVKINDIGVFHKKNSSIVFVGVQDPFNSLKRLYTKLEQTIIEAGFDPDERKYRPHITLGKKVVFRSGNFTNELPYYHNDIRCTKITLFESHRVNGVLTYTPIYIRKLQEQLQEE